MNVPSTTLVSGFLRSVDHFGDRPALVVNHETLTYRQLCDKAMTIAATLQTKAGSSDPPLTAVYAVRSVTAFAGVLGTLLSGNGYVPISPDYPASYSRSIIQRTGCRTVILDGFAMPHLGEILKGFEQPLVMIVPYKADVTFLRLLWPMHTFIGADELDSAEQWQAPAMEADVVAYIMHTSGSTGIPKGVAASHRNVNHFIEVVTGEYELEKHDRVLHLADISFDLCLLDMWIAWEVGACLYCPSREQRFDLSGYLRDNRITVSVSVPSTATVLKDVGALIPGVFPDLRYIWFCGEALLTSTVLALCEAAPNATIVNFYGPTELTCACTAYRWDRHTSAHECIDGVVPIGWVFQDMKALIVDPEMREVGRGEVGELLMTGPQLTQGYWQDPERTAAAYVVPPEQHVTYYRTGDLVRRPENNESMKYVGREDHQLQIHGARVELGEIEAVLRDAAEVDLAIAVGWPVTQAGADGIVAFVLGSSVDQSEIKSRLRKCLPVFMVPRKVFVLTEFPRNANGKIDRKALTKMLNEGSLDSAAT